MKHPNIAGISCIIFICILFVFIIYAFLTVLVKYVDNYFIFLIAFFIGYFSHRISDILKKLYLED